MKTSPATPRSRRTRARGISLAAALSLATALVGCGEGEAVPAIRVGGVAVPDAAYRAMAEPERQTLLDLVALGWAVSADEVPAVIEPLVDRAEDAALVTSLPAALGARAAGLGDAELRAAYAAAPDWELEVRHVVRLVDPSASAADRERARAVAAEVADRAAAGEDFAALAARFSEEPGAAERGGLLEPGRRGSWVAPFWEAAVVLAPGGTSGVVESEYGYHVIRLDRRRPVPYEEASRSALLTRAVPADVASDAMAAWAIADGSVLIEPPALSAARAALVSGEPPADSLVIARGAGAVYTAADLVGGWAGLGAEERQQLDQADEAAFAGWVENDARTVLWADAAREMGLAAPASAAEGAGASWTSTVALWAQLFGFRQGMPPEEVYAAAHDATLSGAPEARAQRLRLRSFRPRLRRLYPPDFPAS